MLAFSRSKWSDVPAPRRPSAHLKDSMALLIDGMPECDCQHVTNARNQTFDNSPWFHAWSTTCLRQPTPAACWAFRSIYSAHLLNRFNKMIFIGVGRSQFFFPSEVFISLQQMLLFCHNNAGWKCMSRNLVCPGKMKLINMWPAFKVLSASAAGGEYNKVLNN